MEKVPGTGKENPARSDEKIRRGAFKRCNRKKKKGRVDEMT